MHHMGVMLEDIYLHHAAVKKNVSRGGNFVCNVLTNILNILTGIVKLLGMILSPGKRRHVPDAIATDPTLRRPAPYP
jgi:hypothetical protein